MPEFIYQMRAVRKAHGDKVILNDVTLAFLPGAKIGVVGPNGTGKSTLLRMMAGVEQPSNGDARLMPGFTVGLLDQEPKLDETKTVLGNVEDGVAETKKLLEQYNEIAEKMATDYSDELLEEMGRLTEQLEHRDAWDLDSQVEQAMDALRCPPPDAEVASLSGGEKRRVALCRLLLSQPDLLLLDEPTNHLDAESVQWLEQHLEKYPGTVVAVTHDRYFLDDVAQWILELDRGHAYPYEGNYSTYLETKAARLKVEGAKDAKKRKRLEDELEWVRSSPRARQAKSRAQAAAVRGDGRRGRIHHDQPGPESDGMRRFLDFTTLFCRRCRNHQRRSPHVCAIGSDPARRDFPSGWLLLAILHHRARLGEETPGRHRPGELASEHAAFECASAPRGFSLRQGQCGLDPLQVQRMGI